MGIQILALILFHVITSFCSQTQGQVGLLMSRITERRVDVYEMHSASLLQLWTSTNYAIMAYHIYGSPSMLLPCLQPTVEISYLSLTPSKNLYCL